MSTGSDFVTRKELEAHLQTLVTKTDLEHAFVVLSDNIRAVGASVERVESHVRGLAEALTSTREQLERKIDSLEARLTARIALLEDVVRQSSKDIQTLKLELIDMKLQLVRREKLDELDARVAALEERFGVTPK